MVVNSPATAFEVLQKRFNAYQEEVWVMGLGPDLSLVAIDMLFRGTVDHTVFHPRDLFRFLITSNAFSFLVGHNHPSGNLVPSTQDLKITKQLVKLGVLIGIPMVDHVIFSAQAYSSLLKISRQPYQKLE